MTRLSLVLLSLLWGWAPLWLAAAEKSTPAAADTLPRIDQRFASPSEEAPSFQKHVVPLFGRLGCNGRACHGSFQGRGGFQLSLFGYDFKLDHASLLSKDDPRVVAGQPEQSLFLNKPLSDEEHEGGQRFAKDGWEYHVFRQWITAGAKFDPQQVEKLVALEVTPPEILFSAAGKTSQLRAIAVWANGTREDVTPLCRFVSGSDTVAKVDLEGVVTAGDPGDTFLVVSYDKAVVTVPVIRPVSDRVGSKYPAVATRTKIDGFVVEKLRKLGVVPSDVCDDATFLRRVSLDLCGTLPSAAEVEAFLADSSPNKRRSKIDELLETPAYAAWWATKLCDFTGNNDIQLNNTGGPRGSTSQFWFDWIQDRIARNVPYDEIVAGIVAENSRRPGQSYTEYCEAMSRMHHSVAEANGSAGYAQWHSMPYFWARNNVRLPEDKAIAFAYSFMGVRVQCAQCHKHPFDVWSKDDFDSFKSFFARVSYSRNPAADAKEEYEAIIEKLGIDSKLRGNDLDKQALTKLKEGAVIPFPEVITLAARKATKEKDKKDTKKKEQPVLTATSARLLGTDEMVPVQGEEDPRVPLMNWLRRPENPYFSKALVNRVWANYFNVGIVEPPDDMSLGNPPSNAPLLDYLARGFVAAKFDMKWLHREICNSDTYQRSWQPNETNKLDERNFSRAVPRRLPAEVAYDAIIRATTATTRADTMLTNVRSRAISLAGANANTTSGGKEGFALKVFGRSIRESNCDCDRSMEASLLQTVYLQNDNEILNALSGSAGTWMEEVSRRLTAASPDSSKTRSQREQVKVDLEKARLRWQAVAKTAADNERTSKLRERVDQLEAELEKLVRQEKEQQAQAEKKAPRPTPEQLVGEAYLRTLSRRPTESERERSLQFLAEAETPVKGVRDLMWALLNTKEFIVNH